MEKMKIPWFNRWASKHGVDDSDLLDIINDLEKDVYDVDLGGGLYKMRVARESEGKSGGYRTILVYK